MEVSNVSHHFARFDGGQEPLPVLDDVSLTIAEGSFVSFLGPSGCGKTTLLRILAGLVTPGSGTVKIDGAVVRRPSLGRAMVFQEFNLLPWRNAQKNIEFALEVQGVPREARRRRAEETLKLVGLEHFAGYFPHQLSGGMKQRIGLARALATAPAYLFMDEPFGALDPQIRELLQLELLKLLEVDRKTVIFVTHSIEEAIFLSDRIVMFSARPGRILRTIDVDLPRPRWRDEEEVKASERFVRYRREIWHLLKQELIQVEAEERA
ncbi:MAG: ABC transporter ATP-binding protein [Betaproteobacteria bacterium]|nr:ABC transporter ATP-binding protein [Betaproteobacteria bacterium]